MRREKTLIPPMTAGQYSRPQRAIIWFGISKQGYPEMVILKGCIDSKAYVEDIVRPVVTDAMNALFHQGITRIMCPYIKAGTHRV